MTSTIDPDTTTTTTTRKPPSKKRKRTARRPREFTNFDVWILVGSLISAICLNWLIFYRLTSGASTFGFFLGSYVTFLVIFAAVTADRVGRLVATDRLMTVVVVSAATVVFIPLVLLIGYILVEGLKALRPGFFFNDQQGITPIMPATSGGGYHAIIGTIEQVGLALLWSLPLALAAAVFLNESRS